MCLTLCLLGVAVNIGGGGGVLLLQATLAKYNITFTQSDMARGGTPLLCSKVDSCNVGHQVK